jgi:hypothetical protein
LHAGRKFLVFALLLGVLMGTVSGTEDGFEDGDYTSDPVWDVTNEPTGTNINIQTGTVKNGNYALELEITDSFNSPGIAHDRENQDSVKDGDVFQMWFKQTHGDRVRAGLTNSKSSDVISSDDISFQTRPDNNQVQAYAGGFGSSFGTFNTGNWYKMEIEFNVSDSEVYYKLYNGDGSLNGQTTESYSGTSNYQYVKLKDRGRDTGSSFFDDVSYQPVNQKPVFNSSEINPDPPLIGENVSYSAEVYDSDGSVQYTNLTLSYGVSTVLIDEQRTGTTTPEWNDIHTPQDSDKWLNATLETVDDQGAVTTTSIDRYLSDTAPTVSCSNPGNTTYYKYGVPVDCSVSDSDSEPSEDWTCTVEKDGSQVDSFYLKEGTNSTYTDTINSDLGAHTAEISCTDGSGNTGKDSESYTVEDFEIEDTSTNSPVYETTNQSFTADLKAGDMVKTVETSLYWDGNLKETEKISNTGVNSFSQILRQETPLVTNNNTGKNWSFKINYNYTDFNGNNQTNSLNSTEKTQQILWSYYLQQSFFTPDNKYIETEDLQHNARIHTQTKKADLSGTTTYKRNSDTDSMELVDTNTTQTTLRGVIDTGLADSFNQSNFQAESEVTVDFNGNTRTIATGNDQLELYRIQLFDTANPGNLNTEKTLEFDIDYEEEGYDTKTEFTMDLSVWKNENEKIRRFQFQEPEAETHAYHIYPSWASYTIQTKPYPEQTKFDLIQYFNPDDNKVRRSYFFPIPQTISNQTTTVPLKTINESEATQIDFEVTQSGGQPAENVYCRVDRKFGGGDFETVFMIKTGSQGNSQSFAEVNEIYYSFTCYKNGEIIETFPAQIMQNPMILNIGETQTETQLDYSEQFDADCSFNQTSISCGYQSQSEDLEKAVLHVDRIEPVTDIQVCNKSSPTATGTLTCNGLNTSQDSYRFSLTGEYPGGINILGDSGKTGSQGSQYGAAGILLTLMIFLFVFAATAFNAPLGIALGTLSILFSSVAGFLALTPAMRATLIGLAILAGVLAHR